MLSSRLTVKRMERTAMFRAESLELLARSRRPWSAIRSANSRNGSKAPLLHEHNDAVPADDPDDVIDPDDSGPRLLVTFNEQPVAEIYALPVARQSKHLGAIPILWSIQVRHNRLLERAAETLGAYLQLTA